MDKVDFILNGPPLPATPLPPVNPVGSTGAGGGSHSVSFPALPIPLPLSQPVPVPIPAQGLIDSAALARVVATKGINEAVRVAVGHHRAVDPATAPSFDELMARDRDASAHNIQRYLENYQGSPNAVALRLLAPRAGRSYDFEQQKTPYTDQRGNAKEGRKCGGPGCTYRNYNDRKRHMAEMHVKDPVTALYCPVDGCKKVHYGAGRNSEMGLHFKVHKRQNERARRRGQPVVGITPYSTNIQGP